VKVEKLIKALEELGLPRAEAAEQAQRIAEELRAPSRRRRCELDKLVEWLKEATAAVRKVYEVMDYFGFTRDEAIDLVGVDVDDVIGDLENIHRSRSEELEARMGEVE